MPSHKSSKTQRSTDGSEKSKKLAIVRRNRGTHVQISVPTDIGGSIYLTGSKRNEEIPVDGYLLLVSAFADGAKVDDSIRFKHARKGWRKVSIANNEIEFDMIFDSNKSLRFGSLHFDVFRKSSGTQFGHVFHCTKPVEYRSEKGPKQALIVTLHPFAGTSEDPSQQISTPHEHPANSPIHSPTSESIDPNSEMVEPTSEAYEPFSFDHTDELEPLTEENFTWDVLQNAEMPMFLDPSFFQ